MISRDRLSLPAWLRGIALAVVVVVGIAVVWRVGEHSLANLGRVALAIGGAGLVAWWATRRPVAAFGVLFVLSTLSRWTIELPLGNMRLEQPAIVAGLAVLVYARQLPDRATLRRLLPIAAAFMVYLGALTASSLIHSPDRTDSLRIVFWTGLSMAGGLLVFLLLLSQRPGGPARLMTLAGSGQAAVGILVAVLYFTLGPVIFPGSDPVPGIAGTKVFAMSWEANIYASLLAALGLFAVEELRSRPSLGNVVVVAVAMVGLAMGFTRGAYLGLVAGFVVYVGVALIRTQRPFRLAVASAFTVVAIVVGANAAPVLMSGARPLNAPMDLTAPGWGRDLGIGTNLVAPLPIPTAPPATPVPTPAPTPEASAAAPTAAPTPTPVPLPQISDTLGFRLDRVPTALQDLVHDPIIGLGANSFGQRHLDPTQLNTPDHIALLAVAALYESGVVGAAGLAIGFLLVLLALWRASRNSMAGPLAAAYLGSIVSLLVAYEATNAINFSLIWLIAGAGLALAFRSPAGSDPAVDGAAAVTDQADPTPAA